MSKKEKTFSPVLKAVSATAALLLIAAWQSGAFVTGKTAPGYSRVAISPPETFTLVKAEKLPVKTSLEEPGIVTSDQQADISPRIMGLIEVLKVEPGTKVTKDQILAEIDDDSIRLKLSEAEKSLSQAKTALLQAKEQKDSAAAALEQALKNYDRTKDFLSRNAASKVQMEDAEAKLKQAKANANSASQGIVIAETEVEKAQKYVEDATVSLGYTTIKAPFDGVITKKHQNTGDLALPGKPIYTISDHSSCLLKSGIPEKFKNLVSPGMELTVVISGRSYQGTVSEIEPQIDPVTRTFSIKTVFFPGEQLFVGTYGTTLLPGDTAEIVFAPEKAVTSVGQLKTVLIKEPDSVSRRFVKTGNYRIGEMIEILSGLNGNESLIVPGE